ncbi:MAG TPA: hypothetical protein VGH44_04220 [Candidatus Saccharimonadia bacterium]|jgi:hypothetical protein
MKRRWLAIALVAFANAIALLSYLLAPSIAEAAYTNCQFADANTITCTDTGSAGVSRSFGHTTGSTYQASGGFCDIKQTQANTLTLTLGAKNANGSYGATINTTCGGGGTVTVANPKNVAPGSGGGGSGPQPTTPPANNNTDPTNLCDSGTLTWLNCAIMSAAISVIDGIRDYIIAPFLHVQPLTTKVIDNQGKSIDNPAYTIWQNFRNVAAVFLILIFFAIIFGTALGFDNYTIKKTLPHLVAGAILMPLSWYICAAMIDIGNILGQGLITLMDKIIPTPYIDFTFPLSSIFYAAAGAVFAIALKGAVSEIGLAILITILIAVLATFFTLVLRQILIITLVVLSPFAIMAWILPNTEKWFTQWWQNLFKLILMYPLIMLLFEAGRIFALTAGAGFNGGGAANDFQKAAVPIIALVGLYLPLGAVPWTFSWAGGAMKAGAKGIGGFGGSMNKRFGKGSQSDKNRSQRRQEKAAASYMGAPTTRLGRALQFKKDKNGDIVERKTAGFFRGVAATRGGFSGAFPGRGPSIVQQRAMAGTAAKALHDEEVAKAAQASLTESLANGSYRPYDERVQEGVQSTIHAEQKKARDAVLAEGQRKGMGSEDWQRVVEGQTDFGPKGHYSGQIAREAAIQYTSAQDYSWDRTRAALKAGTISSKEVRNAIQSVPGAASKARDVALGADAGFTQADWQADKQMDFFSGRGPSHRLGFDKETRAKDLDRAQMLQAKLTAGQTTYVNKDGKTVSIQPVLDTHRAELADSYGKISQSAQDWAKLDPKTTKRIANNVWGSATDIGFTPVQITELKKHIDINGKAF